MEVQLQIRQNALEAQQYMQDLFEWEKKVKEKEKGLGSAGAKAGSSAVPAPRGRAAGSQVAAAPPSMQQPGLTSSRKSSNSTGVKKQAESSKPQLSNGAAGSNAARHTYSSYSKWDKLDVDAMLEEGSDEEGPCSSTGSGARKSGPGPSAAQRQQQKQVAPVAAPMQAPGANAASKVVPAPRQPPSASDGIQIPTPTAHDPAAADPHLTPISSTYTSPPPAAAASSSAAYSASSAASLQPPIRNSEPQTSEAWRTRGNDLFKAGQYAYAKECYNRSIALDPASTLAYANRAMAELKLQEWAQAEEDCGHALRLDPQHVKALHRRGTARRQLGNTFGAAQDFEHALRLEPGNAGLARERDAAVVAHLSASQLQMPSRRTRLTVHAQVVPPPTSPQPQLHSTGAAASNLAPPAAKLPPPTPGLKAAAEKLEGADGPEFPLEMVRSSISGAKSSGSGPSGGNGGASISGSRSTIATATQQQHGQKQGAPTSGRDAAAGTGGASSSPPAGTGKAGPSVAAGSAAAGTGGAPAGACAASPAVGAEAGTTSSGAGQQGTGQVVEAAAAEQLARASKVAAAATAAVSQLHARTLASMRTPPRTSTEFEAVWRSLKGDQRLQARYLGVVPPDSLPSVFKASLTPQLLAGILRALLVSLAPAFDKGATAGGGGGGDGQQAGAGMENEGAGGAELSASQVVAILRGLAGVPRLSMAAMCVPGKERAELRGLWERARGMAGTAGQGVGMEEWDALQGAFKL